MTAIYNRYYTQRERPRHGEVPRRGEERPHEKAEQGQKKTRPPEKGGLERWLAGFLPKGADLGDVLLLVLLLLLYLESRDEELLIVLLVFGAGLLTP